MIERKHYCPITQFRGLYGADFPKIFIVLFNFKKFHNNAASNLRSD
jgi:hypothetical protein